jgi:AraC-like DNA-binding protein
MSRRLTREETARALRALGIERPFGTTFCNLNDVKDVRYDFHSHPQHQLLFPVSGLVFIETNERLYACSPQIGLWLPAGMEHATTTTSGTVSAMFSPEEYPALSRTPVMVRKTPLLGEAMQYAALEDSRSAGLLAPLFRVIHGIARENVMEASWPSLPVGNSGAMKRTIDVLMQELNTISVGALARMTGQSERTMRRRFLKELGIGPELFIQRARLIRAMQLLIEYPQRTIIEIGLEAGYSNHSAFTSAFGQWTGMTPSAFRKGFTYGIRRE